MNRILKTAQLREALQPYYTNDEIHGIMQHLTDYEDDYDKEILLERLINYEPVQYITGKAYFHRYFFKVTGDTLIPRPETEELCERILLENPNDKKHIVDFGTGSGCIPITLLKERSNWTGLGIDISPNAIAVANSNAENLNVSNRIEFQIGDILKLNILPRADIWISNPPYISNEEKSTLSHQVHNYEPHTALFAGEDPLIFYKKMANLFMEQKEVGEFWFEINQYLWEETIAVFTALNLSAKKIEDFSGNPRFIKVTKVN